MSERRKYWTFSVPQTLEIVLAWFAERVGEGVVPYRTDETAERLYYSWREKLLAGRREALSGKKERQGEREPGSRSSPS